MTRLIRISILRLTQLLALLSLLFTSALTQAQWSEAERRLLHSLSLNALGEAKDPSNRYAKNPDAVDLGKALFFDRRLSANGRLSCASCHQPDRYFTDGIARAKGVSQLGRHTPTIVGSAYQTWFYWDGRRDSLWSQALIPFESASEMGSSRLAVVRTILQDERYRQRYIKLFGHYPEAVRAPSLPAHAGPLGDKPARDHWYALAKPLQADINQAYANIGKAIAAFEATLLPQASVFDEYVNGRVELSEKQLAGLKLFINPSKTQCLQCHNGPLLSNQSFHNIGTGSFSGETLDFGRLLGLQSVLSDPFNCQGIYSDSNADECFHLRFMNKGQHVPLKGAFKVPGLRNVANTAPYFHDGRFNTLEEVVAYYNQPPENGAHELKPMALTHKEQQELVVFLKTLSMIKEK